MKPTDWREDLEAARNVETKHKVGFLMVLGWFELWRIREGVEGDREGARFFWRTRSSS